MSRSTAPRCVTALNATLLVALSLLTGQAASAAGPTFRLGSEFQVNRYTTGSQTRVKVGRASDGRFVVVWHSDGQDGSDKGIFAARFDSAGARVGAELQVNSITANRQSYPGVAVEDDGDFVVAWMGDSGTASQFDVFARRFDAQGVAQGVEFQVSTYTPFFQKYPAVASDGDGDFVVVWESPEQDGSNVGIFGQRFNSAGARRGIEFQVNTYTPDYQLGPSIALDDDGDFVVAWESYQDGSGFGVFSRRFTSAGLGGVEVLANVRTNGNQGGVPGVAMDGAGDFVLTWTDTDGYGTGVFARRFNAVGAPVGGELQVNAVTSGQQFASAAAMDAEGDFVVAWQSRDLASDSKYDLFLRRFDSAGVPGPELQVNTYTPQYQEFPAMAMSGDESFVVAWQSDSQDGSAEGIFAQRFATFAVLDVDGDGTFGALTDALLILRYAFGFTGVTLTGGAVGGGCTRCDAASIEAYLATLV